MEDGLTREEQKKKLADIYDDIKMLMAAFSIIEKTKDIPKEINI